MGSSKDWLGRMRERISKRQGETSQSDDHSNLVATSTDSQGPAPSQPTLSRIAGASTLPSNRLKGKQVLRGNQQVNTERPAGSATADTSPHEYQPPIEYYAPSATPSYTPARGYNLPVEHYAPMNRNLWGHGHYVLPPPPPGRYMVPISPPQASDASTSRRNLFGRLTTSSSSTYVLPRPHPARKALALEARYDELERD